MLKIEGNHSDNGVYFIASDGTKKRVATIADNKPARLFVVLPKLTNGEYTLQITTQYNGGGSGLKNPRTGTFYKLLTVA